MKLRDAAFWYKKSIKKCTFFFIDLMIRISIFVGVYYLHYYSCVYVRLIYFIYFIKGRYRSKYDRPHSHRQTETQTNKHILFKTCLVNTKEDNIILHDDRQFPSRFASSSASSREILPGHIIVLLSPLLLSNVPSLI